MTDTSALESDLLHLGHCSLGRRGGLMTCTNGAHRPYVWHEAAAEIARLREERANGCSCEYREMYLRAGTREKALREALRHALDDPWSEDCEVCAVARALLSTASEGEPG